MWKLNGKMTKDKWLILLASGAILMILSFPAGSEGDKKQKGDMERLPEAAESLEDGEAVQTAASGKTSDSYEKIMEDRVKEILSHVEGVGKVDVMIVLKASEEKILHVDTSTTSSQTRETDSSGGSREILNEEKAEEAVLSGTSQGVQSPIVEKEIKPEISGIIISAEGGGSAALKAEISAAMEALFDLPPHRIKVLKRVE